MKKLIIVTHSAANGGAERVSCILANQFVERGYDVTFYAMYSDARQYYLDDRIRYVYCNVKNHNKFTKGIERSKHLKSFIENGKFDVMISFIYLECTLLVGVPNLTKIYTLRNDPAHVCSSGIPKLLLNRIYKNADKIVFQTEDAKNYYCKKISSKGVIIPNPIREDLPEWNTENHSNEIVAACRINEQKNLKMMIDAYNIFQQKNSNYKLVIYGKGDLKDSLEEYARGLNLSNQVLFPGFCDSIQDKMANAAMYVSSSDYEGISNSMLEALAIGTPTVCTDCPIGGARMFIKDGENGFLVKVGDAAEMAEKMLKLINDEKLQKHFSEESKKLKLDLSEKNIIDQWIRVVEN